MGASGSVGAGAAAAPQSGGAPGAANPWFTSSNIMVGMYAIQSINALSSAHNQAKAMKAQGAYMKQQAQTNARLSMMSADDAIKRGDLESGKVRRKASQVLGAQKVNAAAQGIDINSGSAADLQTETEVMSDHDINTIKNNAWREAWGFRVQAQNYEGQGNMAAIGAKYGARQTMLTGGMNALNYAARGAYEYKRNQELDEKFDILGKPGKVFQGETPPAKKKPIQDSEPSRMIASATDDANMRRYRRSKENPLYPGHQLTSSWWIRYDDEGDV